MRLMTLEEPKSFAHCSFQVHCYPWVLSGLQHWLPTPEAISSQDSFRYCCFNESNYRCAERREPASPPWTVQDQGRCGRRPGVARALYQESGPRLRVLLSVFAYSEKELIILHLVFHLIRDVDVSVLFLNEVLFLNGVMETDNWRSASSKDLCLASVAVSTVLELLILLDLI